MDFAPIRAALIGFFALVVTSSTWACNDSFDHKVTLDTSGIWNPDVYRSLMLALTVGQVGVALYEGDSSRLGDTAWRGIDSEIIGAVSSEVLKRAFTRERPSQTNDPCLFFQGDSYQSFPSGEATEAAALVTPWILEYGHDYPAVYALTLIPLYVGAARVKNQAHWQTDVLAGWALGAASGWYSWQRDTPLLVQIMPHGIYVGLKKSF